MTTEYRTGLARWGLMMALLTGSVAGMMASFGALTLVADGWSELALMSLILAIMGVWLGGMAFGMRRFAQRSAVYTLSHSGVGEVIHGRRGAARTRELSWSEITSYTSGRQVTTGLGYLRLRTAGCDWKIGCLAGDRAAAAFSRFRDAALQQLQAHGVPAAPESPLARTALGIVGLGLAAMLVALPIYALSLPESERPEMWGLRWFVLFGLSVPILTRALGGNRTDG